MAAKIVIDPVSRIEGHLKIEAVVENGVVKEAKSSGMMYRGFENILLGRDPRDAARIMQRICGVCPTSHGLAATFALDELYGVGGSITDNGRILRNLIQGANFVQSHILHFYQLAALDYVDVTAVADYSGSDPELKKVREFIARGHLGPFVPRYEGDYRLTKEENRAAVAHYVQALNMRRMAHEAVAVFGGKMPHNMSIVAGGVTCAPTIDKMAAFLWKMERLADFIDNVYLPDVLMVAGRYSDYFGVGAGCRQFLSYGVFDLDTDPDLTKRQRYLPQGIIKGSDLKLRRLDPARITEEVENSWFAADGPVHPYDGKTVADRDKAGAYSWVKSPRYAGEVSRSARWRGCSPPTRPATARCRRWWTGSSAGSRPRPRPSSRSSGATRRGPSRPSSSPTSSRPGCCSSSPASRPSPISTSTSRPAAWACTRRPGAPWGTGSSPRGGRSKNYQAIVPTTWNAGPMDGQGQPGPIEQSLIGTRVKDQRNPFELVRIVRSFDPCLSCAVHAVTPKGEDLGRFAVGVAA